MVNKKIWLGMLVVVLAFGMTVGCDNGSSGGSSSSGDPIKVDLTLPNIQSIASFEGEFVSDEDEAKELMVDAIEIVTEILDEKIQISPSPSTSMQITPRDMIRKVQNQPLEEVYDNVKIDEGFYVTGFVKGYGKSSIANENMPFGTAGDYIEVSLKAKLAINFTEIQQDGYTFNGKYCYNQDIYEKVKTDSIKPPKSSGSIKMDVSDSYALSVSKNDKGIKFLMTLKAKVNIKDINTLTFSDDPYSLFDLYEITIKVYDNDNKEQYSKTCKTAEEANKYLGTSFINVRDED